MSYTTRLSRLLLLLAVTALSAMLFSPGVANADCFEDEEYAEALKQTEDQWQAVRTSMKEGKAELESFAKKYQEYEDIVFSQDMEKSIRLAKRVFKMEDATEQQIKQKLSQVRDQFNKMDAAGLKTKLASVIEKLRIADTIAFEVNNAYQFAKKFDPAHAKDNPTYGLKLIGNILTDGAKKMETVPLVGQILGPWMKAYGDATQAFVGALDRLTKKMKDFRQGSLCTHFGTNTDAMGAFEEAATGQYAGEDCLTYFPSSRFPRLRGMAYQGQDNYFLFSPVGCRGYFSPTGSTEKVYDWHSLLLEPRALDPDWLANRARSLKSDVEKRAREYYTLFSGLYNRSNNGWLIIEALALEGEVEFYGKLDEETFVANYIIDDSHHNRIEGIVEQYNKYVYAEGTVYAIEGGEKKTVSNASVSITIAGRPFSTTSGGNGQYQLLMEGQPGASVEIEVSADGYETYTTDGGMPSKVVLGMNFTLGSEAALFTISGTVFDKSKTPVEPVSGATVTATTASGEQDASVVTGADGTYTLSVQAEENTTVTVAASVDQTSGSATAVVTGAAKSGVDIVLDLTEEATATEMTIAATVVDANQGNIQGAVVTDGTNSVTTGANGIASLGPIAVVDHSQEQPFSVVVSATLTLPDGNVVASDPQTVTYSGQPTEAVVLVIPVEEAKEVTVSGHVYDANGIGVEGAQVTTDKGVAATTTGGGAFSLPPITLVSGQNVNVSATYTDGTNSFSGGPVPVLYDGTQTAVGGVTITLPMAQLSQVTISGRVIDADGKPIGGASVAAKGASTSADGSGNFTLPPVDVELGQSVAVSATIPVYDGSTRSGTAQVSADNEQVGGVTIRIDVEEVPEDEIDDLIDELEDDLGDDGTDLADLMAEFNLAVSNLDGIAREFENYADYFNQRLRELREASCDEPDVAYALSSASSQLEMYEIGLGALPDLYAQIVAAQSDPTVTQFVSVEGEFSRVVQQEGLLQSRYAEMKANYGLWNCDEDQSEVESDDIAQTDADPDDVDVGAESGGGVEVCGDGIDNDGDNEIDECDAGCCDKNVQITVTDCGNAADDIFVVAVDGAEIGVTPKGASNTFDVELSPGSHSVTVTCVHDEVPPGTVCVTVIVFGTEVIGGTQREVDLGQSISISFTVPEGTSVVGMPNSFDGSSLRDLEK